MNLEMKLEWKLVRLSNHLRIYYREHMAFRLYMIDDWAVGGF